MSEGSTPNNYASLADKLRAKQAEDEQEVEQILNEHVESLKQRSNTVLTEIEKSLESVQDKTVARIGKSVLPLALIWGAALLGILLAAASSWYVNSQANQIEQRRQTLHNTPNLHVGTCGKSHKTCVKVKPHMKGYGKHHAWRIIQQ